MKVNKNKLINIIKEEVLKEYYRGFEQDVQKLGFVNLYDAALSMVTVPEYVELLGTDDAKKIARAPSDRYGLSYVLDKWEKDNPGKTADDIFPQFKSSREKFRKQNKSSEKEGAGSGPSPQADVEKAKEDAEEVDLKNVEQQDLKASVEEFHRAGLTPKSVDAIAKKVLDFMSRSTRASDRSEQRIPIVTKIAQSIEKILMGDMSPLGEQKNIIFKDKLKRTLLENIHLWRKP